MLQRRHVTAVLNDAEPRARDAIRQRARFIQAAQPVVAGEQHQRPAGDVGQFQVSVIADQGQLAQEHFLAEILRHLLDAVQQRRVIGAILMHGACQVASGDAVVGPVRQHPDHVLAAVNVGRRGAARRGVDQNQGADAIRVGERDLARHEAAHGEAAEMKTGRCFGQHSRRHLGNGGALG